MTLVAVRTMLERFSRKPYLWPNCPGTKQGIPILKPYCVSREYFWRGRPILTGVILIEEGIPQPLFLGMPFFTFMLPTHLRALPPTPLDPCHDGIGRIAHGSPPLLKGGWWKERDAASPTCQLVSEMTQGHEEGTLTAGRLAMIPMLPLDLIETSDTSTRMIPRHSPAASLLHLKREAKSRAFAFQLYLLLIIFRRQVEAPNGFASPSCLLARRLSPTHTS